MNFLITPDRSIQFNISKYKIDWDEMVKRGKFGKLQWEFKKLIQPYWENHIVYEELKLPKSRKSLDFFNLTLRVAVEIQGSQHTEYNPFFHGENRLGYYNQKMRDMEKANFCKLNEITLVEIFQGEELSAQMLTDKGLL